MARLVAATAASPQTRDRHLARAGRLAWIAGSSRTLNPLLMLQRDPRAALGSSYAAAQLKVKLFVVARQAAFEAKAAAGGARMAAHQRLGEV